MSRPRHIILIAHGESELHLNHNIYNSVPAHLVKLSPHGINQSLLIGLTLLKLFNVRKCNDFIEKFCKSEKYYERFSTEIESSTLEKPLVRGLKHLKPLINEPRSLSLAIFNSPYVTARKTLDSILNVWDQYDNFKLDKINKNSKFTVCSKRRKNAVCSYPTPTSSSGASIETYNSLSGDELTTPVTQLNKSEICLSIREDPRLREQDFANNLNGVYNLEDLLNERNQYGPFLYRFPQGESSADVFNRCKNFNNCLYRYFDRKIDDAYLEETFFVIISHEIFLKVWLMNWLNWTFDEFERSDDIRPGELIILKLNQNYHKYELLCSIKL